MLEGAKVGVTTQQHLDRCLSCRSCETTCPSGVEYGRLLDIGKEIVETKVRRKLVDQIKRCLMLLVFPYQQRFKWVIGLARLCKPVLPSQFKQKIPLVKWVDDWPQITHDRKVLLIPGCVQPVLAPSIDVAAARVLDKLEITLTPIKSTGCCGALNYHLSDHEKAKDFARKNIDACWPYLEQGAEAIIITASGCGVMLKDYATILQYDSDYAEKAKRFSAIVKDISEILVDEDLSVFKAGNRKVAFQSPCTLQHGQKLAGVVEFILQKIGYDLVEVSNTYSCCGSAGVYSLLQPELSEQLRDNKLKALQVEDVELLTTANIGCLIHLQTKASKKIIHWIELLDENM
jgi:glycolate oxidase iron-sulfur subunit